MRRLALMTVATGVAVGLVATAPAATRPDSPSIVIRHELRGCHTWSLNGGPYRVRLEVALARGGTITIHNNDPMVHQLVRERGPAVRMTSVPHRHMKMVGLHRVTGPGVMNHMGAALKVTFARAGTYRFTTKDRGDYFELRSVGPHNHLLLAVSVS